MEYVLPFLAAMVVTMALLPMLCRWAGPLKILDHPGFRKVHLRAVPRVGGIAIAVGALVAFAMVGELGRQTWAFLIAATVILLFGLLDDRFDLDYRIKLLGQLLAIGIVVFGGGIAIHWVTFDDRRELPNLISLPLTFVFLVGITNAINLSDGLDGLAGGVSFLCFCALGLLANGGGQPQAVVLACIFAGATLGFLRFNTYPATVFMGDTGSQLLGFVAGVLSILATQAESTAVSAALPLLLLGVPILDTLWVMVQRIGEGRSPFSPDKNHIHHKLLALGFDHHEAVAAIYALQALLFVAAYLMRFFSDGAILAVFAAFSGLSITALQLAGRTGWRLRGRPAISTSFSARLVAAARRSDGLPRLSLLAAMLSLAAYVLLVVTETTSLNPDLNILVVLLLVTEAALLLVFKDQRLTPIDKAVLYVTAAVVVFLDTTAPSSSRLAPFVTWVLPLVAAIATALCLRLAPDRRFVLTPLDLIVFFVVLIVPNLPGTLAMPTGAPLGIAKLLILFYALEMVAVASRTRPGWLRLVAIAVLVGLQFKASAGF